MMKRLLPPGVCGGWGWTEWEEQIYLSGVLMSTFSGGVSLLMIIELTLCNSHHTPYATLDPPPDVAWQTDHLWYSIREFQVDIPKAAHDCHESYPRFLPPGNLWFSQSTLLLCPIYSTRFQLLLWLHIIQSQESPHNIYSRRTDHYELNVGVDCLKKVGKFWETWWWDRWLSRWHLMSCLFYERTFGWNMRMHSAKISRRVTCLQYNDKHEDDDDYSYSWCRRLPLIQVPVSTYGRWLPNDVLTLPSSDPSCDAIVYSVSYFFNRDWMEKGWRRETPDLESVSGGTLRVWSDSLEPSFCPSDPLHPFEVELSSSTIGSVTGNPNIGPGGRYPSRGLPETIALKPIAIASSVACWRFRATWRQDRRWEKEECKFKENWVPVQPWCVVSQRSDYTSDMNSLWIDSDACVP